MSENRISKERNIALVVKSLQSKTDARQDRGARESVWHVVALVVMPVASLSVITATTLGCVALVRLLTAADDFFVQQQAALLVVSTGLVLAAATYTAAIIFALRKIKRWHQANSTRKAIGAMWGLGATALVVLLPFLLAIFFH